jgi:MFS transporter, FSR family, fosmidomycin resistance protein
MSSISSSSAPLPATTDKYGQRGIKFITPSLGNIFRANLLVVIGLLSSHLLIDIYNSLLPVISPLLIKKYSLSLSTIGLMSALLSFTGAFVQPVYGYLCDRFNTKWLVLTAPFLICLSCIGLAYAPNLLAIYLCLIFLGTGFSLYHPKATATVGALSKAHRGAFVSFFVACGSLGSALSPLFVLLFVSEHVDSLSNLAYAWLPAAAAFYLLWNVYREKPQQKTEKQKKRSLSFRQAWAICSKKNLIILSIIVAIRSASILTLIAFISQFITHSWGWSLVAAGYAAALLNVGSLLGGLCGGIAAQKWDAKLALCASLLVSAPCFLAFIWCKSVLFLSLGAFFSAWSNSICVSLSQQEVPAKLQSTASSLTMGFAWGVGAMVIPFVGLLADRTNLSHALVWSIPGPLILAGVICLLLSTQHPHPSSQAGK